jgi:hypothetical protein
MVRAATQACVIGVAALLAFSALAAPAASPPAVPIFFDVRELYAVPRVHVHAFGGVRLMLVDTGSDMHVMGPTAAGISRAIVEGGELLGGDSMGRRRVAIRAPIADFGLAGWPAIANELWVSTWGEGNFTGKAFNPVQRPFDGVLAPIRLAGASQAVVLDFLEGSMSIGTWKEAKTRLATGDLALTSSPVQVANDGKLVVTAVVGGHALRMALDTGAPVSVLFVPRADDLPDNLTRMGMRAMEVRAGELRATTRFSLIERLEPIALLASRAPIEGPGFDGLIGMDVLHSCVLAFDSEHFEARCRSGTSVGRAGPAQDDQPFPSRLELRGMRGTRSRETTVQAGTDGVVMQPRADGGYEWTGAHLGARIRKDGTVSFHEAPAKGGIVDVQMDKEEERRWFEEQVGGLLITMARAHDRELILDALDELPRRLSYILDNTRMPLAERRRILFLLWDEMAEPDDSERGWAGAAARRLIDTFIQRRLGPGTPGAYTADEIAAFNRTRTGGKAAPFNPYAPPEPTIRDDGAAP